MSLRREYRVPFDKDSKFPTEFFYYFSDCIDQLGSDTGRWPNKVTFVGKIGKELFDIINEKEWDFKRFNLTYQKSILNKIIIEFDKPLDQIEERGYVNGDSLTDQTMEGIPGDKTVNQMKEHSMNMSFTIERKIRPNLEVILKR
jgi:hypothetical protein